MNCTLGSKVLWVLCDSASSQTGHLHFIKIFVCRVWLVFRRDNVSHRSWSMCFLAFWNANPYLCSVLFKNRMLDFLGLSSRWPTWSAMFKGVLMLQVFWAEKQMHLLWWASSRRWRWEEGAWRSLSRPPVTTYWYSLAVILKANLSQLSFQIRPQPWPELLCVNISVTSLLPVRVQFLEQGGHSLQKEISLSLFLSPLFILWYNLHTVKRTNLTFYLNFDKFTHPCNHDHS